MHATHRQTGIPQWQGFTLLTGSTAAFPLCMAMVSFSADLALDFALPHGTGIACPAAMPGYFRLVLGWMWSAHSKYNHCWPQHCRQHAKTWLMSTGSPLYATHSDPEVAVAHHWPVCRLHSAMLSCNVHTWTVPTCAMFGCDMLSCDALSCNMLSCNMLSCNVLSCDALSCDALSCDAFSCAMYACTVCVAARLGPLWLHHARLQ